MSAANARFSKKRTLTSGFSILSSERTKATVNAMPTAMQPIVFTSSQPQTLDCCRPKTTSPIPMAKRISPRTSRDAGRSVLSGLAFRVMITAAIAIGTLIQKIARQVISIR